MGLQVVKRNGQKEDVRFDAIQEKLSRLSEGLNQEWVDPGLEKESRKRRDEST